MLNKNRWWESYLVRYLVGNIFAVIVLFYLFINYDDNIARKFCEYDRGINFCNEIENNNTTFSKEVFSFIFQNSKEIKGSSLTLIDNTIITKSDLNNTFRNYEIITTDISFVSLIIMGLLGFMYMYIASIPIYFMHIIRGGVGNIFEFYKKSSKVRDKVSKEDYKGDITRTYIESYQHMREHGNAHGIILMELLFAFFLIHCNFSIFALVFWLLFGFFGWVLGIYLENKMIDNEYKDSWFSILPFYFCIVCIMFLWLASYSCKL
ncbi:hypothetical protein MNB_SV-9-53 [hydrothermal vent metagenome]|uniref:Uncharacterized protein n=1 Tax=hydrothermal vent metagenome TaxID=652676 RepID=A0A1W1CFG7_9ZZZZ